MQLNYRVWDKEARKWTKNVIVDCDGLLWWMYGYSTAQTPCDADKFVVCVNTNLKDKNGKDVYEGDIVSLGRNVNQRRVIGWWEDTHGWGYVYPTGEQFQQFRYYQTGFMKDKMEIIGNIYESPDFLK